MVGLIDTHCHLASTKFEGEIDALVQRSVEAGVTRLITIGTNLEDSRRNIALAEAHSEIFATVGIHPCDVLELPDTDWISELREMTAHPRVVAIGEIGLDYFHPPATGTEEAYHARQAEVFAAQLALCEETDLNAVVHQRESYDDTIAQLQPWTGKLRAVLHCFSQGWDAAQPLIEDQHLVSFTGIATFKNAQEVQQCATDAVPGSFMVETDAPYLSPVPHRGKRCEPAFTRHTAEHIAQLRGISLETLTAETTATAEAFFRFP